MSSAVAHSLRNPLATIRSSAELAQEIASPGAQRNIGDIISQVDRMSRWVRELLVSLRPMNDDGEAVDLVMAVEDTFGAFDALIKRSGVEVRFSPQNCAPVVSQRCCSRKYSIACLPMPWKPCPRAVCSASNSNRCSPTACA